MMADIVPFDPIAAISGETISQDWVARQFANEWRDKLAYCHDHKSWFMFDGAIWRRQSTGLASHFTRELAARMAINAKNRSTMQGMQFCRGVEVFTQNDPVFARSGDQWDNKIWLAGTPTQAIDLITGNSIMPKPSDMITKTLACDPDEFENCPVWEWFLNSATAGDNGLIRMLQQICGMALTGDISEQALFFIFGPGGNGKGVFLSVIQGIMGDYSVVASMEALENQKFHSNTAELAMMRGARLVSASESKEGAGWNEQRVKALTGGDKITARYLYSNPITFTPQLTLLIIGNHKPTLTSVDEAMRRRINMIPFTVKPAHKDPHLIDKLRPEWPGILRWMINGCVDWRTNGLHRPPIVVEATEQYFDDQNTMQEWMAEFCEVDQSNNYWTATSTELFTSWAKYAKTNGIDPGTAKTFKPAMERSGFRSKKGAGARYFFGIQLRHAPDYTD